MPGHLTKIPFDHVILEDRQTLGSETEALVLIMCLFKQVLLIKKFLGLETIKDKYF